MTISIILPNYNHAHYLNTSLNAILTQSQAPDEVIIIDDASTDNSLEVLAGFGKKYKSVKILKNKKNLGPIKSVNRGLEVAIGDYVAFCSADDYIEANFLAVMADCLDEDPRLALCSSDFGTFKDNDIKNIQTKPILKERQQQFIFPNELKNLVKKHLFWIPTNATLYRRKFLNEFVPLNEDLKWMSDWYLNYQLAFHHPIAYIPQRLTAFRRLTSSYCHNCKNRDETYERLFKLLLIQSGTFQRFFRESGILYQQGRSAFKYLLLHPKRWNFLPQVLKNIVRFKFTKKY